MSRRFVVSEHAVRPGEVHWDLMVEDGDALVTFQLAAPPGGAPVEGKRLADHRAAYLEYEGPISGDRGAVRIRERGLAHDVEGTPRDARWRARLEGDGLRGLLVMESDDERRGADPRSSDDEPATTTPEPKRAQGWSPFESARVHVVVHGPDPRGSIDEPATRTPEPERARGPLVTLLALALAASLGGCARGCDGGAPSTTTTTTTTTSRVTGRVVAPLGSATRVVLVDPPVARVEAIELAADGSYAHALPADSGTPWVVVEVDGGGVASSRDLDPTVAEHALAPVAVWTTGLRIARQGERVRIDWAEIPAGQPGFPRTPRYSLLVTYLDRDGQQREATYPARAAFIDDTLEELLGFMPGRDVAQPVTVTARCFDPDDARGFMWIGGEVRWNPATGDVAPGRVSGQGPALPRR